uniref:ATPase Na+/K+ transporting family member beta 4 n=1 Tax=Rattus norvegicus TaxID=10116 RepID=Q7TPI3_RAT|nr:Ac2-628 [Rattus norvegicus]
MCLQYDALYTDISADSVVLSTRCSYRGPRLRTQTHVFEQVDVVQGVECGGLNMLYMGSGNIRRCGLVGVEVSLLEEVCHFVSTDTHNNIIEDRRGPESYRIRILGTGVGRAALLARSPLICVRTEVQTILYPSFELSPLENFFPQFSAQEDDQDEVNHNYLADEEEEAEEEAQVMMVPGLEEEEEEEEGKEEEEEREEEEGRRKEDIAKKINLRSTDSPSCMKLDLFAPLDGSRLSQDENGSGEKEA